MTWYPLRPQSIRVGSTAGTLTAGDDSRLTANDGSGNLTVSLVQMVSGAASQSSTGLGFMLETSTDSITAYNSGGQANATLLNSQTNRITTAASPGASVKLPPSVPGLELVVINHAANSIQVYGSGTDTVNDVATATGVSHMPNSMVIYTCVTAGAWYTDGLNTGFIGGFPTQSYQNTITAHSGGGQPSGTPITAVINRVTVVAVANDSVTLPVAAGGIQIQITNAASNSLNIFPASGDQINTLGVNAAFALVGGKSVSIFATVTGQWHTILSA